MRGRSAIALCVLTSLASSSCSGTGLLATDGGHERLALNRLLLAAYERPTFDDARNDVPAFCADFTPDVARAIASAAPGSDCPSALRPFTSEFGHASRLSRSLPAQFMRHFQISRIMRDRSYASATVGFGGGGSRIRFRLIAGRWRLAVTPRLQIQRTSRCSSTPGPGCSSGVFAFSY